MARSDLLLSLVKAGRLSPDPRFRSTVESIIAEERAKQHTALADQLASALVNGTNGSRHLSIAQPLNATSVVGELAYETAPTRPLSELVLPNLVLDECRLLLEEHHRKDLLQSYGMAPRHRLLLVGPPGNGKTSLANAIAYELAIPLLTVRYEGLIASYLGETATRVRKLFEYARQRPCVLFIDEFDTIAKERGDLNETGEIKRVVSTLLLQMDQLPPHVIVVTATNHSELLDRAVWRRFELRLTLTAPSPEQTKQFVKRLFSGLEEGDLLDVNEIARIATGSSYSEIEQLFQDVARRMILQSPGCDIRKLLHERALVWKQRVAPDRPSSKPRPVSQPRRR